MNDGCESCATDLKVCDTCHFTMEQTVYPEGLCVDAECGMRCCSRCDNSGQCTRYSDQYGPSKLTGLPRRCKVPGCTKCDDDTDICSMFPSYYSHGYSVAAEVFPFRSDIIGCVSAHALEECQVAGPGYRLLANSMPVKCAVPDCFACDADEAVCDSCMPDFTVAAGGSACVKDTTPTEEPTPEEVTTTTTEKPTTTTEEPTTTTTEEPKPESAGPGTTAALATAVAVTLVAVL